MIDLGGHIVGKVHKLRFEFFYCSVKLGKCLIY